MGRAAGDGPHRGSGFALISAIFLIVILAGLAAAIASLSSVQHATSTQQLSAARSYYAARAGLEWAAAKALAGGGCPEGVSVFSLPGAHEVHVACSRSFHRTGRDTHPYYQIEVEARSDAYGRPAFSSRRLHAKLLGIP